MPSARATKIGKADKTANPVRATKAGTVNTTETTSTTDAPQTDLHRACRLHQEGRYDGAARLYQRILERHPHDFNALHLMGTLLHQRGEQQEALYFLSQAQRVSPQTAAVYNTLGCVFIALGRLKEAIACFEDALKREPEMADALNNLGMAYGHQGQASAALDCYLRALTHRPDDAVAHHNAAITLARMRRFQESLPHYRATLDSGVHFDNLYGEHIRAKMNLCDWEGLEEGFSRIREGIQADERIIEPYFFLPMPADGKTQRRCAEIYVAEQFPNLGSKADWRECLHVQRGKIRVAYCSADYRNHPVSQLLRGVFEQHDKHRFEIHAFAYGPPNNDPIRHDLESQFDQFIDVSAMNDERVLELAQHLEIDIAVDLGGHTGGARMSLFARRMAPLQLNYLGYPGSLGASFYDYIVADRVLIRSEETENFSEKAVVWLPHACQPNDDQRPISEKTTSRSEAGLPEDAFVFCCFNNNYKIGPKVFDIWMRLLLKIEGSVLWLNGRDPNVIANLRREAESREVAPERLVFAARIDDMARHLARLRLADLFLDTFYFNAHSTASDALWAGLPVLTCPGETYISRMATSLLHALELPELVADSAETYESMGLQLAQQPDKLSALRQKLANQRLSMPLFNTQLYTRHLESAYATMHDRQLQGLPPQHFQVSTLR